MGMGIGRKNKVGSAVTDKGRIRFCGFGWAGAAEWKAAEGDVIAQ
jgi:hypothetical protein